MTTAAMTEADVRVRDRVLRELEWDPEVDASGIGVTAEGGAVTLTGTIGSYFEKLAAERAAKRVQGVRAVANDIDVRLRMGRMDADLAADAAKALELRATVPAGVQAAVHEGHITLTGTVGWLFQKQEAENAVRRIRGVRGIANYIHVTPRATVRDVQRSIARALHQNADVDARHITVRVADTTATLTGTVSTWLQRASAERAAASAPGVVRVDNQITIEPAPVSAADADDDVW